MDSNPPEPYYDDDESDHEIESDDSDGFEFDDNEDAPDESEPADSVEESGSANIIDLVADGKATEVKQQIFQSLYARVGERLDAMKAETRGLAFNQSDE